jgi:hypothetical protein
MDSGFSVGFLLKSPNFPSPHIFSPRNLYCVSVLQAQAPGFKRLFDGSLSHRLRREGRLSITTRKIRLMRV